MIRVVLLVVALAACAKEKEPLEREPLRPTGPRLLWTVDDEKAAFARARAERKGVLVDLYATWSTPSQELEAMLGRPALVSAITASFVPLRIDISNGTDRDEELRARYNATTLPALMLVGSDGTVYAQIVHLPSEAELLSTIDAAARELAP